MQDCLGRTPFPSLIATLICGVGVAVFCFALWRALDITLRSIFEELFMLSIRWLESIQVVFIIVAVTMGCYAIILLVFGFLATGATRDKLYSGAKCIMGGRVSAIFFMVLTYIMNIIWIAVTSTCAIPIIIYVMLNSICVREIQNKNEWYFDTYCLNLSRFGIYVNSTEGVVKNALCEDYELGDFCQGVADAGPMYGLAFGSSLLIVLSMVMFMIIMATNYQRIKSSKEITEYRNAVDMELSDSRALSHSQLSGY